MTSNTSLNDQSRRLAIIGTAGRGKTHPMTSTLWNAMTNDLASRLALTDHLVSGGAAWADHLAVDAFLKGLCGGLTLFLPAPILHMSYEGPRNSAGSAANYYHSLFSKIIGKNSIEQIVQAQQRGAAIYSEPVAPGYGAMFARNKKVASNCSAVIAYTFNPQPVPADGGTMDTWNQIAGVDKLHIDLIVLTQLAGNRENDCLINNAEAPESVRHRPFSFAPRH